MFHTFSIPARLLLICLTISLICGCGKKQTNFQVSGTITFNGKPVPDGEVFLRPSNGNSGSGGYAVIENGKYTTVPNRGSEGGFYNLTFHGFGGKAIDEFGGGGGDLFPPHVVELDLPKADHVLDIELPEK